MKYCKTCLQPDTRPNTYFSKDGICPACNYFESLKNVDWDERKKELAEIVKFGKENSDSGYDCIIGVSGGKDSTRQALYVRDVLGMNPLLVSLSHPPPQITQRGADNLSNLVDLGFDIITINPAPETWRALMKKGFIEYGNCIKSTEFPLFSSVPRVAIAYQIPLIWWGENPGLQLGDLGTMGKTGGDGNRIKYMNTLGGGDITWLLGNGVEKKDILQYTYPSDAEMERAGLRIVYLGYYWDDWSLVNNGIASSLRGLDIRREPIEDIGDPFGVTALDEDWVTFNQMMKYYKFGFGRVADYVNEEVRLKRMTREEGINLLEKYDGTCSEKYIRSFCDYIEITVEEFWAVVDRYVNRELFEPDPKNRWKRKFKVGIGL